MICNIAFEFTRNASESGRCCTYPASRATLYSSDSVASLAAQKPTAPNAAADRKGMRQCRELSERMEWLAVQTAELKSRPIVMLDPNRQEMRQRRLGCAFSST
mmetsp:Transcript_94564/g.173207  ORF Transcript_94564/g.173207 Transcript_94564/m.173207 type:complete len:103 (+) Transcript_94564:932-1240(+)